ncbi:MAG: amidohydrolase family protein [Gammaproteobacteria bacterium]|nr:amidohydrolase family protein [Gammaproteobacteria bacterium]
MKPVTRRTFMAAGLGAGAAAFARLDTGPDAVLYNGRVLTMSGREREVEALALTGSCVLAIGTSAQMLALAGAGVRRIDLAGKRVTPGFNDAHSHPCDSGVALLTQVALEMDSIEAVTAALHAKAAATPPGEWVVGFLYDDTKTPRALDRADLDAAAPGHPVIVQHRGGHTAFVNSRALELVGIGEDAPNPPHGEYFRDADGRHNGRVAENAVDGFLRLAVKAPSREDYRKGAALISRQFASRGITSACEADGSPATLQGYLDARDAGELAGRFYNHIDFSELDKMIAAGVHTGFGDEWVRVGAVKLFADGSISERTALLSEPYAGLGDFRGISRASRETLYAQARKAYLAGWQVGTHANGDVAIDTILGVYEQLQREVPRRDPRLRIEHCTLVTPDLVRRIKAAGVIPLPFAGYVYFHGEKMHFYGEERLRHMFAMRDFLDAGIRAAPGSDYTASPAEPMMWLRSEVTRTDASGHAWGANQRITVEEAVRCSTVNGAYASFEESIKGSLEPGRLADLVVWDQDFLALDPAGLLGVKPERTMVGGRWVYEA